MDTTMNRSADSTLDEEEQGPARPGAPVDVRRIVRVVWRNKRYVILAALLGASISVPIAKFGVGRTYSTSASVRYEGLPGQGSMEAQRELPSLVAVTSTDRFLLDVRAQQGLGLPVDALRELLNTTADQRSGLINFTAYGETPEAAAEMANGAVGLFLLHHEERRRVELQRELESVQERITAAGEELREARAAYDAYRREHGITDLNTEQERTISQAAELRTQADLAAAEVTAGQARVAQLESELEELPRAQRPAGGTSTGSRAASQRLTELSQRLREARGRGLGESHPQVQSLARQVRSLERSAESTASSGGTTRSGRGGVRVSALLTELQSDLADARTELEAARNRAASLERLAVAVQARANHESDVEAAAANLLAAVNVKTAQVESLTERSAAIDDQLRDVPTGFRSVTAAVPPESAVPSKKKKIIAAGVPLALAVIVLVFLIGRELWGLRLATPNEVAWWGKGPVVGTSTWPRRSEALYDLIADLEELVAGAEGELLMLGVGDAEHKHARRLAFELTYDWDAKVVVSDLPPGAVSSTPAPSSVRTSSSPTSSSPPGTSLVSVPPPPRIPFDLRSDIIGVEPVQESSTAFGEEAPITGERIQLSPQFVISTWDGSSGLPALRRRARRANGVLVVVSEGVRATELMGVRSKLGRDHHVAFLLLGAADAVMDHSDRAGHLGDFLAAFTPA